MEVSTSFLCSISLNTTNLATARADMIHAGGLLDLTDRSGLRVHGCFPLHRIHTGCGVSREIEWHSKGCRGEEYSEHLLRENGTPFTLKPKDGQFCYALDMVEKFPTETAFNGHRPLCEIDDKTLMQSTTVRTDEGV